jgi:hypothetical protein
MANPEMYTRADEYGNDPLNHVILKQMDKITRDTQHTVTQDEEANPQLIAYDFYNDIEMFYVILAYNGIANGLGIKAGDVLRVPEYSQLTNLVRKTKSKVTI